MTDEYAEVSVSEQTQSDLSSSDEQSTSCLEDNHKTPELVRLRALRTYYFTQKVKKSDDEEYQLKADRRINDINLRIAGLTGQPIESITVTYKPGKRGRPRKHPEDINCNKA